MVIQSSKVLIGLALAITSLQGAPFRTHIQIHRC